MSSGRRTSRCSNGSSPASRRWKVGDPADEETDVGPVIDDDARSGSCDTALRIARALEFGSVTVNEAPTFRSDQMPYGGVKDSGNTREGPRYAVRELTEQRLVVIDL
jgi:acyl-CoA reductase-like NAD-dependent aldehyde dehydrogenase